jgi:hypothetical protein
MTSYFAGNFTLLGFEVGFPGHYGCQNKVSMGLINIFFLNAVKSTIHELPS